MHYYYDGNQFTLGKVCCLLLPTNRICQRNMQKERRLLSNKKNENIATSDMQPHKFTCTSSSLTAYPYNTVATLEHTHVHNHHTRFTHVLSTKNQSGVKQILTRFGLPVERGVLGSMWILPGVPGVGGGSRCFDEDASSAAFSSATELFSTYILKVLINNRLVLYTTDACKQ